MSEEISNGELITPMKIKVKRELKKLKISKPLNAKKEIKNLSKNINNKNADIKKDKEELKRKQNNFNIISKELVKLKNERAKVKKSVGLSVKTPREQKGKVFKTIQPKEIKGRISEIDKNIRNKKNDISRLKNGINKIKKNIEFNDKKVIKLKDELDKKIKQLQQEKISAPEPTKKKILLPPTPKKKRGRPRKVFPQPQ